MGLKSQEYIFVGYCENVKAYRLMDPQHPTRVRKKINVMFIENFIRGGDGLQLDTDSHDSIDKHVVSQPVIKSETDQSRKPSIVSEGDEDEFSGFDNLSEVQSVKGSNITHREMYHSDNTHVNIPVYPKRVRKPTESPDMVLYNIAVANVQEPESLEQVLNSTDRDKCIQAMEDELKSSDENE
ncbi:hypothetical protein PR048_016437 [Dryococelus australis]|uniref:Retroviral polymerase SH3-like domain-containing protein n=1 Tax=Dryococelus australis TaxID=614101 RepID=A0ABQ9HJQ7_9NEOP|nr:hypothetical protein PR048_016437 [Dryococelus australis]